MFDNPPLVIGSGTGSIFGDPFAGSIFDGSANVGIGPSQDYSFGPSVSSPAGTPPTTVTSTNPDVIQRFIDYGLGIGSVYRMFTADQDVVVLSPDPSRQNAGVPPVGGQRAAGMMGTGTVLLLVGGVLVVALVLANRKK